MFDTLVDGFVRLVADGETYVFLLPIYVLLLSGERIAHALTSPRRWNDADAAANIAITITVLALDVLLGKLFPVAVLHWVYEHACLVELPAAGWGWLVAFLLHDLIWYVDHRLGHRVGLLWALHHVHHSSPEYNMTVASRGFVLDNSLTRPLFYLLPVLGVTAHHYIVVRIVTSIWGIVQHTRLIPKLGWFDRCFATPSTHRVHHGTEPEYIDRNYGEVSMLWDHLFGTYQREVREPSYGVTEPIHTHNPLRIELAGLAWLWRRVRSAERWSDRLRYLVKPPEWQHDAPRVAANASAVRVVQP